MFDTISNHRRSKPSINIKRGNLSKDITVGGFVIIIGTLIGGNEGIQPITGRVLESYTSYNRNGTRVFLSNSPSLTLVELPLFGRILFW